MSGDHNDVFERIFSGFRNTSSNKTGNYYCLGCKQCYEGLPGGTSTYCPACAVKHARSHIGVCELCNRSYYLKTRPNRYYNICDECYSENIPHEKRRLKTQLNRAKANGCSATLTLKQWLATIKFFEGKCAYCQSGEFDVMEHITSISKGGGTTAQNCLPSCKKCNGIKRDKLNPELMTLEAIARIQAYLVQSL